MRDHCRPTVIASAAAKTVRHATDSVRKVNTRLTCSQDEFILPDCMGLIQIRHVPEDVHRTLKARAAAQGTSLSDYVLREVTRVARTPTPEELDDRICSRSGAGVGTEAILAARKGGRRG